MSLQGIRYYGDVHQVWDGDPGGYCLSEDRRILWMKVPSGESIRLPVDEAAPPGGRDDPLAWQLIEETDGTLTVDPSIDVHDAPSVKGWHGHLRNGLWDPA
jgi:hypothetical protein